MNLRSTKWWLPLVLISMVMGVSGVQGAPLQPAFVEPPWQPGFNTGFQGRGKVLSGARIEWSAPMLADLNNDGNQEIVVGATDGKVWAVKSDGTVLWTADLAARLGGPTRIDAAVAIGDVNKDNNPEVVVATGRNPIFQDIGAVFVLNGSNGQTLPGWPRKPIDREHDGFTEGINSSPAIGDLDKDGDLEIVVGAFDKFVYAWHHDGTAVAGFPYETIDTIWSSPALADIDKDSYLEIIIGTDVGNFWPSACPYTLPGGWPNNYCGGSVWVFNHDGTLLPGFPVYTWDIVQSSPAIADLNEDGWLDIIAGTGGFYYSTGHSNLSLRLYAWDHNGQALPGWQDGKQLGDVSAGAPAIGDIDNDGHLEVVAGTQNQTNNSEWSSAVFAYERDGTLKWKTRPVDWLGSRFFIDSPILADYNDDGIVEVLFNYGWGLTAVRGTDGAQITYDGNSAHSSWPLFYANYTVFAPPAVGDIDNDKILEVVAAGASDGGGNAAIYVWQPKSPTQFTTLPQMPWPMFRQNTKHTGMRMLAQLGAGPSSLLVMHQTGDPAVETANLVIKNSGGASLNWSIGSKPAELTLGSSSGSLAPGASTVVTGSLNTAGRGAGQHSLGNITINATSPEGTVLGTPFTIPVNLYVGTVRRLYVPIVLRN